MTHPTTRLLPTLAALAALAAGAAIAGCGAEDDAESSGSAGSAAAEEPPQAFARRFAREVARVRRKRDCDGIEAVNERSIYDFRCPALPDVRRSMARFEVTDAAAYGTGAVIDYKTLEARDGASMVVLLAPDGRWAISRFGILADASVGTDDGPSRAGFDEAVDRYLAAVRGGDCDAYRKAAVTSAVERRRICSGEFEQTKPLARRLRASGDAQPDYLGGNETFGFYGLTLDRPEPHYFTISVVKAVPGSLRPFLVLNVASGPLPDS